MATLHILGATALPLHELAAVVVAQPTYFEDPRRFNLLSFS